MKKIKKLQWIRIVIQGICFIYFPALFSQAFLGIKNIFVSMGKGTPLVLNDFSVILLLLCLFTMFFGRFFCGFFLILRDCLPIGRANGKIVAVSGRKRIQKIKS